MAFTTDDIDSALTTVQKNVIKEYISSVIFDDDMIRRLQWAEDNNFPVDILLYKYAKCFLRMKKHWTPIFEAEETAIPENDTEFAELVFAHDDYKDRATRDAEEEQ